jgi:hypothetical protein
MKETNKYNNTEATLLNDLRNDVDLLYKTVYHGNGTPSLITQISKLEHRIDSLQNKLDSNFKNIDIEMSLKFKNITDVVNEKFNYISYQISQEFDKRKNDASGRWTFKTGALTASVAGCCSIIAIIVAELLKKI